MKKLSIILVISMLMTLSYSCSEDFLDKKPLGSTSENVFYNEKGINALLIGAYAMTTGSALWDVSWGASIQNWTYGSAASDDAYKGSEKGDQTPVNYIERWEVSPTNAYPADKWNLNIGMGVDRVNKTLRIIGKTETDGIIDAATADKFRAEARFLRGLFYFELRLVFGDYVPLLTEETEDPTLVSNENADGAVLKFITDDLNFAAGILPPRQKDVGRATKWAAKALAARAYLQDLKYAEAKPLLDDIIANGGYTLAPNFIDNYQIATNNNAESIFEIQANVNDIDESLNAEMGIGLNWPHGSDIGTCCGFHQPSQNLVNAFKVDAKGLPMFDTFNNVDLKNDQGIGSDETFVPAEDLLDPRLDWTVSRRGIPYRDWGINRGRDWIRYQPWGGPYMPASKPFFNKAEQYSLSTTTGWQTGINANNFRYLRLTHVLLWRAEIAAFDGELGKAKDLINQVRVRAGNKVVMGKVLINQLPATVYPWGVKSSDGDYMTAGAVDWSKPAANYKIGLYDGFANKEEAMRAAQWELRLEFGTEGMRFFDLRRWDKLPGGMRVDMIKTLNDFAQADLRIRSVMKEDGMAKFDEKDMYQPIPQNQLDLQPGVLKQRPGY